MKIIDVKSREMINKIHHVKTGIIYNTEHAMAVHITLEPGEN